MGNSNIFFSSGKRKTEQYLQCSKLPKAKTGGQNWPAYFTRLHKMAFPSSTAALFHLLEPHPNLTSVYFQLCRTPYHWCPYHSLIPDSKFTYSLCSSRMMSPCLTNSTGKEGSRGSAKKKQALISEIIYSLG